MLGLHVGRRSHFAEQLAQDLFVLEDVVHDILRVHVHEAIDVREDWIVDKSGNRSVLEIVKPVNQVDGIQNLLVLYVDNLLEADFVS